jgi:hypothetical protein
MDFDTTPLPWSLDCDGDLMAADRTLVAIIPAKKDRPILAAAPDMLSACKTVLASLEKLAVDGEIIWLDGDLPGVHESAIERLKNVIAQAEGQPVSEIG